MLDGAALAALAVTCRARRMTLISDEIYHGISYGERAVSALEVEPAAIVVNSFSKLWRMPGWRLGWIVVPAALAARLSAYLINFYLTAPTIAQYAALAAFDDRDELARPLADYRHNRELLHAALAAAGVQGVVRPEGAFYLYADVSHLTEDSLTLCERLLAETGVAIAPGLDFDPVRGGGFVRLSFAISAAEADRAAALLQPWLRAQPRL